MVSRTEYRVAEWCFLDFVLAELFRFRSPDNGLIFAGAVHPGGSVVWSKSTQYRGSSTQR